MTDIDTLIERVEAGETGDFCPICGVLMRFPHDHKPDNSGLDDGPSLERTYTRRAPKKSAQELSEIRSVAWQTRRKKYGPRGHSGAILKAVKAEREAS